MRARHVTTGVTLLLLIGILATGAVYGAKALFAPASPDRPSAGACDTKKVEKGQRIRARQVQVSVYNAGTRSGLADQTMLALTKRGFKKGSVGNAPDGSAVKVAQVWTTRRNDAAARLVARQFGASTRVRFVDDDLGPGVDVVVGNGFGTLAKARSVMVVRKTSSACLPSGSDSAS